MYYLAYIVVRKIDPLPLNVYQTMAAVRQELFQLNLFIVSSTWFLATYATLQDEQTMIKIDRPSVFLLENKYTPVNIHTLPLEASLSMWIIMK